MTALTLLLLIAPLAGQQVDVRVEATLSRNTADVGETVVLTISVRASGLRNLEIHDFKLEGLEIIATSDRSSFRFSTAVGAVREFSREYTLRPLREGRFTIPPIGVSADGRNHETDPLELTIAAPVATPLPGSFEPEPGEEVAVRMWVEPESAYVGQQVTMSVAAFFDPLVRSRLQRQPEYRAPDVQGFWTMEIPGTAKPERRVVAGREYFVQIFQRALFPLTPGTVRIPSATVTYEVRRGLIYAPETFQVESAPAEITVLALPEEGRPADFAGAVGRYDAEVRFDRSEVRAGEAVNLIFETRGEGNLSALARPQIPEIPGVRVYDGAEDAEVELRGVQFAGHKRFSWVLVPERAGEYVIPKLRLPYFDPEEGGYRVAVTEPLALRVAPGAAGAASTEVAAGTAIRFLKAEPGRAPLNLHRRVLFWIVQAVPLTAFLGLLLFARIRDRVPTPGPVRQRRRRRESLRALRPVALSGDATYFSQLRAAVLEWLGDRLQKADLPNRGVVYIQHALEDAGVPPPVALQVIDLLERCSRLRYSPRPPTLAERLELLDTATRLLKHVDREAVSGKRMGAASGSGTVLLGLAILALQPAALHGIQLLADPGRTFDEGVAAYTRGEYADAVGLFEQALAARPGDPHTLYNLGDAYYELGDRGKAAAVWVKALRILPRDGDARHNLRLVVGDDPVVGSALPPVPLSSDEMALVFSTLWFVGFLALIARKRWRTGLLTFSGGASLTVAVLVAGLLMLPRSEYGIVVDPEAVLRAGPVRQSEVLATPVPGTGYLVRERRGDWLRVSRGGESEGWVEARAIEVID